MTLGDRVAVLREGTLQQVGDPRSVYERPANLFVAGFVGAPPMNLAEATLDRMDGGVPVLIFGGHRIRVDDTTLRRRPGLASYLRRQVVIGIRPEDFVDAADANAPPDARLRVPVSRSETVGADTFVQFVMDSPLLLAEDPRTADVEERVDESWPAERPNVWMARRRADPGVVGDVVELSIEPGKLHVFDPRTGRSIED